MQVTIEVKNKGTLNLLRELEVIGFIQVQTPVLKDTENSAQFFTEQKRDWRRFEGCCKNSSNGSVDEFLARCREDKKYELAIEQRDEEERARRAIAKLSS